MFKVGQFSPVCFSIRRYVAGPSLISTRTGRQEALPTGREGHCGCGPEGDTHGSVLPRPVKN